MTISSLATKLHDLRTTGAKRTADIFGLAVHQTGESIVTQALSHKADPLEYVINYYLQPDSYYPHYVIGYDGTIAAVCDEETKALHIGFQPEDRQAYLSGDWTDKLPQALVELWQQHWPGVKSPAHLFPGPSPNNVYVGVEMLPIADGVNAVPASWVAQGRYTKEQHQAVVSLAKDLASRYNFANTLKWWLTGKLVCHEDVNPIQRSTKSPAAGWDPGALRANPWFDMDWVRMSCGQLIGI